MDVRRLAAIDMHGLKGRRWRRNLILAEFIAGVIAASAVGLALILEGNSILSVIVGVCAIGIAANYLPLSIYAIGFSRAGALAAELAEVDVRAEARHYTRAQAWVFVPFALLFFTLV